MFLIFIMNLPRGGHLIIRKENKERISVRVEGAAIIVLNGRQLLQVWKPLAKV